MLLGFLPSTTDSFASVYDSNMNGPLPIGCWANEAPYLATAVGEGIEKFSRHRLVMKGAFGEGNSTRSDRWRFSQ